MDDIDFQALHLKWQEEPVHHYAASGRLGIINASAVRSQPRQFVRRGQ